MDGGSIGQSPPHNQSIQALRSTRKTAIHRREGSSPLPSTMAIKLTGPVTFLIDGEEIEVKAKNATLDREISTGYTPPEQPRYNRTQLRRAIKQAQIKETRKRLKRTENKPTKRRVVRKGGRS